MGLLGNTYDPYGGMSSLLGIDQKAMRNQALWNGLAAAGFTLMGNKNIGAAGGAFLQGTNQARDDYYRTALDAYRLKSAEEERAYQRERDATADERWQMQFDYNKGRQQREDARQNTLFDWQMQDRQQQEDMRMGQQNQVQDWMGGFEAQGGNLFSPEMQMGLRQQGIHGVDPRDTQKYERMQPLVGAGMYPEAFQQMTAEPAQPDPFTLGEGQIRYDGYGNPIAAGMPKPQEPKTRNYLSGNERVYEELTPNGWVEIGRGPANAGAPSTTINNLPPGQEPPDQDLRKELSKKEAETWSNYEVAADQSGGLVQQLQIVDELAKTAPQGPISGRLATMFPGVSSAGDAFNSIVTRLAPSLRTPGSGSQSDREFEAFLTSMPRLANSPEGNAIISAVLQAKADIDIRRGEIVAAYRNNEISAVEARRQLGALRRESILKPEMQAIINQATGEGPNVDDLVRQYGGE